MTAYASDANIEKSSPDCRRTSRDSCGRSGGHLCNWRDFFFACLAANAGIAFAGEATVFEEITVPIPAIGGSFESSDGSAYESVLAEDSVRENIVMGEPNFVSVESDDDPLQEDLFSCIVVPPMADRASAHNGLVQWDSVFGYGDNSRCQVGTTCGPHGGRCRDQFHGADNDPYGTCHGSCPKGSRWAIQAEALVLWRDNIDGQPLLKSSDGAVALDAGDVRTAAAAGPRIGVLYNLGCGRAIEGNYFNVGGIQGSTSTDGLGAPYTSIGLADYRFIDIEEAEYTTRGQIKSAELNYRWCQGRRVIWLAGLRWVEWNETATVDMQEASGEARGNNIQANVGNDLYGGQFGCRFKLWDLGKWQVGAVGKAGVFGNTAYQRTTLLVDGVPFGPLGADESNVAFFGEVGVNSTLWLNRWLAWRVGYNFFWLQGVATAAQQFPLGNFGEDTASINANGAVFLQGFSTGLETRW